MKLQYIRGMHDGPNVLMAAMLVWILNTSGLGYPWAVVVTGIGPHVGLGQSVFCYLLMLCICFRPSSIVITFSQ